MSTWMRWNGRVARFGLTREICLCELLKRQTSHVYESRSLSSKLLVVATSFFRSATLVWPNSSWRSARDTLRVGKMWLLGRGELAVTNAKA
jgi:hypothetical protein